MKKAARNQINWINCTLKSNRMGFCFCSSSHSCALQLHSQCSRACETFFSFFSGKIDAHSLYAPIFILHEMRSSSSPPRSLYCSQRSNYDRENWKLKIAVCAGMEFLKALLRLRVTSLWHCHRVILAKRSGHSFNWPSLAEVPRIEIKTVSSSPSVENWKVVLRSRFCDKQQCEWRAH